MMLAEEVAKKRLDEEEKEKVGLGEGVAETVGVGVRRLLVKALVKAAEARRCDRVYAPSFFLVSARVLLCLGLSDLGQALAAPALAAGVHENQVLVEEAMPLQAQQVAAHVALGVECDDSSHPN